MKIYGVLVLVAAACGGGGGNAPDAPGGDDATPDGPPGPPRKVGVVGAFEETITGAGALTGVLAQFTDGTASGTPDRVDGACVIHSTAGETGMLASAGTVTVTRGNDVVTLVPDGASMYAGSIKQGLIYKPGDTLTVAATGATVPQFSGDVVFPDMATVSEPTTFPSVIKDGFMVAWTGAAGVRVQITQSGFVIQCDVTGTSAMIPASALSDLVAGNMAAMQISLQIGVLARTPVTAGEFSVELQGLNASFAAIGFSP